MRILGGIEKRKEWTEDRLRAALAVLDIKKSGPAPNFWEAEGAIFAQKVGLLGVTALGMSMRQQQAELRSTQRDMGEVAEALGGLLLTIVDFLKLYVDRRFGQAAMLNSRIISF